MVLPKVLNLAKQAVCILAGCTVFQSLLKLLSFSIVVSQISSHRICVEDSSLMYSLCHQIHYLKCSCSVLTLFFLFCQPCIDLTFNRLTECFTGFY